MLRLQSEERERASELVVVVVVAAVVNRRPTKVSSPGHHPLWNNPAGCPRGWVRWL